MELIPRVKDTFSLFKFNKGGDAVVETKVVPRRIIHSEEFFTQLGYLVELWKFIGVNGVEVIVHSRVRFVMFFRCLLCRCVIFYIITVCK